MAEQADTASEIRNHVIAPPVDPVALPTFRTSPQRDQYLAGLLKFQTAAKNIEIAKTNVATVRGESKASGREYSYTFMYADIADVLNACLPALAEAGLVVEQYVIEPEPRRLILSTTITHVPSGQWAECLYPLISDFSKVGSHKDVQGMITAVRRYALCPMIGVASELPTAAEEDDKLTSDDFPGETDRHPNAPPPSPPAFNGPPRGQAGGRPQSPPPPPPPQKQPEGMTRVATPEDIAAAENARMGEQRNPPTQTSLPSLDAADELPLNAPTGQGAKPSQDYPGTVDSRVVDWETFKDNFVVPAFKRLTAADDFQPLLDKIIKRFGPSLSEARQMEIRALAKQYRRALL